MCFLGICKRVGSGELSCVGWTSAFLKLETPTGLSLVQIV